MREDKGKEMRGTSKGEVGKEGGEGRGERG